MTSLSELAGLARVLVTAPDDLRFRAASGGPIATGRLDAPGRSWFVKHAPIARAEPLRAEADGLVRLAAAGRVSVPSLHGCLDIDDTTWLLIEWIDLEPLSSDAATRLGRDLADLHRSATTDRHGLDRDNWIGATPQVNPPTADWAEFLFRHRIGAIVERLADAGTDFGPDAVERLHESWTREFTGYAPIPSLLHGDLWSGNAGQRSDGTPVTFDPAVHYGDRECDLAMAALFGGFDRSFFEAYDDAWPLESGWERRREFYQLYHVLNHALLFGGGYLTDARRRIDRLLPRSSESSPRA